MYLVTSFAFFIFGGILALMIRAELAQPGSQYVDDEVYNQLFTMHGTIMLLLFATPLFFGFGNAIMPLQIGAPDVAFPRLNMFSYWLYLFGGLIVVSGFIAPGGAASFGWFAYAPLSDAVNSPGVGGDLWIMGLWMAGLGTILGAVNFVTTIFTMRAPGMTMFRMPIFVWNTLVTSMLVLIAFPIFAAALLSLEADRQLGAHVFDAANGGPILWQHLFWFFGHPEVYIIALPFFGIITEILPVFSRKPIFGYVGLVGATLMIAALSVAVWAHHMFVTGAVDLAFFSFMTFLIAVPTGVKFFNWIGTLWGGSLSFDTPLIFSLGFLVTFLFGGLTGIILAAPTLDFPISDSYFVVAHFHYVVFGTVVFAMFAGFYYWWPKLTGRMLDEKLGKIHFWLLFLGFHMTFLVQHWLGVEGMPRRYADYVADRWLHHAQRDLVDRRIPARRVHAAVLLQRVEVAQGAPRSTSTTRGAGDARSSGPRHRRRRATTSCRCRASVPTARHSTCITPRSLRWSSPHNPGETSGLADAPDVNGKGEAISDAEEEGPLIHEGRNLDNPRVRDLLRADRADLLGPDRGPDRHLGAGHDDPAVRAARLLPRGGRQADPGSS